MNALLEDAELELELARARAALYRAEQRWCQLHRIWPDKPWGWQLADLRAKRLIYARALRRHAELVEAERKGAAA
mgnify:CR=1 FL=1